MAVKLPWEEGIFEQIFSESDGIPRMPVPQMAAVEVVDAPDRAPKFPACSNPFGQGGGRGVYLRVINFGLNLSEAELEERNWTSALEKCLSGFLEALRFCEHVIGISSASCNISIKAKKIVELSDLHRKEKRQARVLTVQEVQALELTLLDETEEIVDRYAAGAFLFCLYSRSTLSDLRKVRGYYKDILETNGTITGYLEFRTRSHKTSRLVAKQGLAMPLVAPVWGLLSLPWGLTFARIASLANRDLGDLVDDSLLPAPSETGTGTWQGRAVTTTEAGNWVRSLLSKRLGEIDYTTIHALKSTPLSWCAKAGLDQPTRLLLGHHTTGKQSADVYARDVLAAPLREFDIVLQNIRNGSLRPDATRSGMVGKVTEVDPKDSYVVPPPADTDDKMSDSSSSSESETSSADESHTDLLLPGDPVGEEKAWEVDLDMYQHVKSKIVHVRAAGSQQEAFSCGVRKTADYVKEALRARGLEVHLTETEIDAVIGNGVTSLARLAFAAAPPGTTPSDEQIRALFGSALAPNMGTLASMKRLVFEAQTLVVADVKNKVSKKEENIPTTMAPAERENRITEQRKRLTGLRLRGEEEV
eukprot:s326_g3.t1